MGDSGRGVDSMTSLMWLPDLSLKDIGIPGPIDSPGIPSFAAPCSHLAADPACMATSHVDYKTNPHVKPPYSYATLICVAMEASDKPHITLSAIYEWISNNFCYFRHVNPTWQNSIRHNLSSKKRFIRVPREKGEPGKGGFWKLDPQYANQLKNGASKKRRMTPVQLHPTFTETAQPEAQCVASPAASAPASKNILTVSVELQQLLEEFEEVTGDLNANPAGHKRKLPTPEQVAKVPRLSSSALLSQGEQPALGSLEGDLDWEAIFNTSLNGEFSFLDDQELTPPNKATEVNLDSTGDGQHIECAQGQEQVLTEPHQNNLEFETFMATSLLQHAWDEDDLSNWVNIEQLFEPIDASLQRMVATGAVWHLSSKRPDTLQRPHRL